MKYASYEFLSARRGAQSTLVSIRSACPPNITNMFSIKNSSVLMMSVSENLLRGSHGRDRMVVGFTTTYAINGYHH